MDIYTFIWRVIMYTEFCIVGTKKGNKKSF